MNAPLLSASLLLAAAAGVLRDAGQTGAGPDIAASDIARHIETLASDAFEGRGPGTPGEERAVRYLVEQFTAFGLEPGVEGGSWLQPVPMLERTPDGNPRVAAAANGEAVDLISARDVMITSPVTSGAIEIDASEVVFVGHGVVAPEYGWDDYDGLDVEGKTVVCLVNDPGFRGAADGAFRGRAMTYYGRWTYKYEEAERQGAAACLIVHEDEAAGYGWTVVVQSWGRPQLGLASAGGEVRTKVRGWIQLESARRLFDAAGVDLDERMAAAKASGGGAGPVGDATFSASLSNRIARVASPNVIAKVPGAERPDEAVLVTAHWDHLGKREGRDDEDNIYNGAVDNASGTAVLLELAEAVAAMDPPPARTVLFVVTTAEEKGLLGSKYYATDPVMPLSRTVAGLNIDVANVLGPMEDIVVVGYGASELDDDLRAVAAAQGRTVSPEPTPEKGFYFRSDHFSLAKEGVPMLYTNPGTTHVEKGAEWVAEQAVDYTRRRYHRVRDEYDPSWDLTGAADDARLFHALVTIWANDPRWREWAPDSEFRAAREASLEGR